MNRFAITIEEAVAPHSSLAFKFWGEGIFIFALVLLYTVIGYSVFRARSSQLPTITEGDEEGVSQ
jgi:cytochrome d ubiquinol oxidase subunit II